MKYLICFSIFYVSNFCYSQKDTFIVNTNIISSDGLVTSSKGFAMYKWKFAKSELSFPIDSINTIEKSFWNYEYNIHFTRLYIATDTIYYKKLNYSSDKILLILDKDNKNIINAQIIRNGKLIEKGQFIIIGPFNFTTIITPITNNKNYFQYRFNYYLCKTGEWLVNDSNKNQTKTKYYRNKSKINLRSIMDKDERLNKRHRKRFNDFDEEL